MYKVASSRVVYKNQWIEVSEDSVLNEEKGILGIFNTVAVDDSAIIVPQFEDGSLLMVENYRHGIRENILELPGGLIKDNKERPHDTARRELFEETGYICENLEYVNWFYTWPGRTTQRNFVFLATGLKKEVKQNTAQDHLDAFEYIQVYKISKEEALLKIKNEVLRVL